MSPDSRAMIAAAAYAFVSGNKVAGLYDHRAGRHLRIAAEARGEHLQGFDGERSTRFGGSLPELYDAGDASFVSMAVQGSRASGYDRRSSHFYTADVSGPLVQLYDYGEGAWFAFGVQST